ncbi:MAG: cell division protein FtsZ, partial [Opitutales bacterium]
MEEGTKVLAALAQADMWIARGVRSICQMLFRTGVINLDFATLRTAFCQQGGKTLFGLGRGEGETAVDEALNDLELCPLLYTPDFTRAIDRLLINILGGPDLSLADIQRILGTVKERFGKIENTVFGAVIDESLGDTVEIVVLGTSDMSNRRYLTKLKHEAQPAAAVARTETPMTGAGGGASSERPVHHSKLDRRGGDKPQEEFLFVSEDEQRGFFETTEKNLYDGEDLDVPTYLRRGVRIQL